MRMALLLLFLIRIEARAQTAGGSDVQMGRDIWQGYFGLENDCKLCHGIQGEGSFFEFPGSRLA